MAHGAAELLPVAGTQAVEQIEPAAAGGHQRRREAATHRQPAEPDSEHQLHHHRRPERRQGVGTDAIEAAGQIKLPLGPRDAAEAHRQAEHRGQQQGHHPQLQAGGQAVLDDSEHRLLAGLGQAQIAAQQIAEEMAVLHRQRLIEAQLGAQGGASRGRGLGAEQRVDRIAGSHPQQQEHQRGDQPQHQRRQGEAGGEITEQVAAAAHRWLPPEWDWLCRSASTSQPAPSKRGGASDGRAQATGAISQTGR